MLASEFFAEGEAPALIVPPEYLLGESRASLFQHFWGDRPVIVCQPGTEIRVSDLFWFEQPVYDSPRPKNHRNLIPKSANVEVMTRFRSKILEFAKVTSISEQNRRKIFLAREPDGKRLYNQLEIHQVAESRGYEIVDLNRLWASAQVSVVSQAHRIVGPQGSAFANLLFSTPGGRALIFARADIFEDWHAPFSEIAGIETYAITRDGRDQNPLELDPLEIGGLLNRF